MPQGPTPRRKSSQLSASKEFKFASKEGLIFVSLILFIIYSIWYTIFEYYYGSTGSWRAIFWWYSLLIMFTMIILLFLGLLVFWRDRRYIITHEKSGALFFILGALILFTVPLAWSWGMIEYQGAFASNSGIFIGVGISFCVFGSILLARTGGFYIVWLIGLIIYLVMSFHEVFQLVFWTGHFGIYDNFVGAVGVYVVVTSFILILYHDLKYFYLIRVIRQGNRFRARKQYGKALRCFKRTLRVYPLFTTAWNNMGNVFYNQGKLKEAVECYKKALNINPEYVNAVMNLTVVSKRM